MDFWKKKFKLKELVVIVGRSTADLPEKDKPPKVSKPKRSNLSDPLIAKRVCYDRGTEGSQLILCMQCGEYSIITNGKVAKKHECVAKTIDAVKMKKCINILNSLLVTPIPPSTPSMHCIPPPMPPPVPLMPPKMRAIPKQIPTKPRIMPKPSLKVNLMEELNTILRRKFRSSNKSMPINSPSPEKSTLKKVSNEREQLINALKKRRIYLESSEDEE